jgi:hypothetical protein
MQGNGLVMPVTNGVLRPSLDTELEQSAATLERPWRVGSGTLNTIASVLASTRRLEDQTSATAVLPSVRNLVGLIDVYAGEARSQVRDQALTLASELHCYAGWLWLEARSHPHAAMHFDTAMSLAVEADNADHLSHAASFKGYMALQTGKLGQAISLSKVSVRDTRTFTALRAFDRYQEAHVYALAGTRRDAENTLLLGDRLLEHVTEDPMPPWAYWYDLPFLLTQRAIVHQALGEKNKAIADFETGLTEMPAEHRNADWAKDIRTRLAALRTP